MKLKYIFAKEIITAFRNSEAEYFSEKKQIFDKLEELKTKLLKSKSPKRIKDLAKYLRILNDDISKTLKILNR